MDYEVTIKLINLSGTKSANNYLLGNFIVHQKIISITVQKKIAQSEKSFKIPVQTAPGISNQQVGSPNFLQLLPAPS
jgi:hypothetical protein